MRVRVDLNITLDGFATTTDQTPENPFGEDWGRMTAAYVATRTFQVRVMGNTSGEGTTGVDEKYAAKYFEAVSAEIMGAGMFGLHNFPDDPDWRGWWGENPPFQCPVYVLTHRQLPSMEMEGGTTFHFLDASPAEALAIAQEAAGDLDVRIGGGATVVRDFLAAGLVDLMHLVQAPIVLGRGVRIWDGLEGLESGYDVEAVSSPSGVTHLTFTRKPA